VGRTTASGALLYSSYPEAGTIFPEWVADLDPDGRPGDWKRLNLGSSADLWPVPTWSPDSSQIVWTIERQDTGQVGFVARMLNLATGKERDLYRGISETNCIWAARHASVFCSEVASDGTTTNIFSIEVDSGRTEQLGAVRGRGFLPSVALPNDQAVYFVREAPGELTRWDIGTGQETLLERSTANLDFDVDSSPDGGWLKRFLKGNIEIRPMAGGDWKALIPQRAGGQSGWSPDGKWIFYHDVNAAGKDGLYRAATGGSAPERLGDFPTGDVHGTLRVSPDGRRIIALTAGDNVPLETWLLENFEPKRQAAK
jgi:Tol biopolymer transport system component